MRIGSFITPERIDALADAGGEYAELFATRTFMVGDRDDARLFVDASKRWPTPPRAFSGLIPAELKLCGPEADPSAQDTYLDELFWRIERLADGHQTVATVGSAGARHVPEGFSVERAKDQIADFLARAGKKASTAGVRMTLEHLYNGESNIFNTLRECGDFIRERDLDNVYLVADLYHLTMEGEPMSTIAQYGSQIVHTHVADRERDAPGTGDYPFAAFFEVLASIGYTGDCSIEAFWTDFDSQVERAVHTIRTAAADAGYALAPLPGTNPAL